MTALELAAAALVVLWVGAWIVKTAEIIADIIECRNCVLRKECDFLIFSEHCQRRYCLSKEERERLLKKIDELDD